MYVRIWPIPLASNQKTLNNSMKSELWQKCLLLFPCICSVSVLCMRVYLLVFELIACICIVYYFILFSFLLFSTVPLPVCITISKECCIYSILTDFDWNVVVSFHIYYVFVYLKIDSSLYDDTTTWGYHIMYYTYISKYMCYTSYRYRLLSLPYVLLLKLSLFVIFTSGRECNVQRVSCDFSNDFWQHVE